MDITLTVWTVIVGSEDGQGLADLNVSRDRARDAFVKQVADLPDKAVPIPDDDGSLSAHAGLDWVRLSSRPMRVSLRDLIKAIAEADEAQKPTDA